MDEKSSDWQSGARMPTVCRCCLADGCYKDISTEYFWMGKKEVYADMLTETFDLSISYPKAEGPSSNSRLICEACISRLRDAAEFKKQVQECEKMFTQHLDPGRACMEIIVEPKEEKFETVKAEKENSDNDDNFNDSIHDDDDDYDELDDEPLTKLATKPMKKENPVIEKLLSTSQITLKRKTPTTAKAPATKKAKKAVATMKTTSIKNIKPSASKTANKPAPKTEKKKEGENSPARNNAVTILSNSTAYPFRVNDKSILCVYCQEMYEDPDKFRDHVRMEHPKFSVKIVFYGLPKNEFVKADITDLKCRICGVPKPGLEPIAHHLKEHGLDIDTEHKLGIMPYSLKNDKLECVICAKNFPSIIHLNRHTITHFSSFICDFCGRGFIASTGMLRHIRTKHTSCEAECMRCHKVFPSLDAKEKHRRNEKSCLAYSCPKCPERFHGYRVKRKHMETVHGQKIKEKRCVDCDISFSRDAAYYEHFKLHHSNDCLTCKQCGLKFISTYRLKRHQAIHNN